MEEKQLYGQTQTPDQNQPYNTGQAYNANQPYQQNQAYNANQPYGQNQAYTPNQPYGQQNVFPSGRAVVYDTMPMRNNNVSIAGLIIGIFALLGCWVPIWNLVLSIAGIICSAIGLSHKGQSNGMAIGGLVMSIIALLLGIFITVIYLIVSAM